MANDRNELANKLTRRGIALLQENTTASLKEALGHFDKAIELRSLLPIRENHWFCYGFIAGWMNRGDALTRLGSPENLVDALRAYDKAVELLHTLPIDENPLFKERLAIAWINRGITLQEQGTASSLEQAVQSFEKAIVLLRGSPENRDILASALTNQGNAILRLESPKIEIVRQARKAAQEALALVVDSEKKEVCLAETGFKARHVLCRAIAHLLSTKDPIEESKGDMVAEATDAVEDGMKLAQFWERQGINQFRSLVCELFAFGSRVYQIYQPHFLAEFLLEQLDSEKSQGTFSENLEMQTAAVETLWRALREIQSEGFKVLNTPKFNVLLDTLRELRVAEARLGELRQRHLASVSHGTTKESVVR